MPRRTAYLIGTVALVAVAVLASALVLRAGRRPGTSAAPAPSEPGSSAPESGGAAAPTTAGGAPLSAAPLSAAGCLARRDVVRLSGVRTTNFSDRRPADDRTYDFRGLVSKAYGRATPPFPVSIGIKNVVADALGSPLTMGNDPGARTCVIGGAVLGQMARSLTWGDVKRGSANRYDGDALQMQSAGWSVVNGFRTDNVEDAIVPYGLPGDTMYVRNVYASYVRDDCIENDWPGISMVVEDSLFDGCFMGISQRPNKDVDPKALGRTSVTYDGVLMRIQPMPHEKDSGRESGQLFKVRDKSSQFVLKNSVFLVEQVPLNGKGLMSFPPGTRAQNVTLVWTGGGRYPASVPSGARVTNDASVWAQARSAWLRRHGCPASGDVSGTGCKNMIPELR